MTPSGQPNLQSEEQDAGRLAEFGGWLFKHRTAIPLPIAAALLLIPPPSGPFSQTSAGMLGIPLIAAGEWLRLWSVRQIGAISRTRSDRLGPLIETGPFALVRNPLYLGNILIWLGFTLSARLIWLAPVVGALLAVEYQAIVRWEERLLQSRMGPPYRGYMARVPRWIPRLQAATSSTGGSATFSWKDTLYSERGTLIAILVGYSLLWIKARAI